MEYNQPSRVSNDIKVEITNEYLQAPRPKVFIGLDVSSKFLGISIIDHKLLTYRSVILKKALVYDKFIKIYDVFEEIKKQFPDRTFEVYIEAPISCAFQRSSGTTHSVLYTFNAITSFIAFTIFNVYPIHVNVRHALKALDIKHTNGKGGNKHNIIKWCCNVLGIEPPMKKNRLSNHVIDNDKGFVDACDAIIVGIFGALYAKTPEYIGKLTYLNGVPYIPDSIVENANMEQIPEEDVKKKVVYRKPYVMA